MLASSSEAVHGEAQSPAGTGSNRVGSEQGDSGAERTLMETLTETEKTGK